MVQCSVFQDSLSAHNGLGFSDECEEEFGAPNWFVLLFAAVKSNITIFGWFLRFIEPECSLNVNFFGFNWNTSQVDSPGMGIVWNKFDGSHSSLAQLILAIRPTDYDSKS